MAASSRPSKTYDEMTVVELRSLLRARGLPTTGKKADLIARLLPFHSSHRATSPSKISSRPALPGAYASHRHASPTRAASPVRVSSSPPARLSGGMPSGLGSSSGATLEARRISLHHYIMAGFPIVYGDIEIEESLRRAVMKGLSLKEGDYITVEMISEWQMEEVRSLPLGQLAAAEHLMDALDAKSFLTPTFSQAYGNYKILPIVKFLIINGKFVLRIPYLH